jgi:hypothetical protein
LVADEIGHGALGESGEREREEGGEEAELLAFHVGKGEAAAEEGEKERRREGERGRGGNELG